MSFVPHFEEINVEYDPGTTVDVDNARRLPSAPAQAGRRLRSHQSHRAMTRLTEAHDKGEVLTGVFYVNTKAPSFLDMLNMVDQPLATLPESITRPGREALEAAMEELR